jgi:integrase
MGHVKDRWYTKARKPSARHGTGLRWQVWYQVDGHETCGGSFANKEVAKKKLIELESSVQRGVWVDPTDQTTVIEYARQHFATRPHSDRTARRIESMIRNHLDGTALGGRRLASVRPSEVQAWATDRSKMLAPSTTYQLVKVVRGMFNAAVLDRLIATSPCVRISVPRTDRERIVPLTVDQVATLAATVKPRYRAMVLAQAGLGLRMGELLALRVNDIDFLRRTVRVEHQIDKTSRQRIAPKTPKSRRTLPLPDMVTVALAEHIRQFRPTAEGLLFHTSTAMPYWHEFYTQKVFAVAVGRANLPAGTVPHDLRHHYASVLLAAGESVIAVAERLGHENANLVLSTYGHLMPGSENRTRKAVDGAWSAASGETVTAPGRPG